jgi:hypothetical protein
MTTEHAADAGATIVAKLASTAQVAGPVVAVGSATKQYLGYTLDEWSLIGIIAGIALGVLGYLTTAAMNWYFRSQHLKLAQQKAGEFYDA